MKRKPKKMDADDPYNQDDWQYGSEYEESAEESDADEEEEEEEPEDDSSDIDEALLHALS